LFNVKVGLFYAAAGIISTIKSHVYIIYTSPVTSTHQHQVHFPTYMPIIRFYFYRMEK